MSTALKFKYFIQIGPDDQIFLMTSLNIQCIIKYTAFFTENENII